jgi:hypothetical protein
VQGPLEKAEIVWKQMNVIILHFLFRISGAELSEFLLGGDGFEKGTGYTTDKLTKFFDTQKRFPKTKAHISILKAMVGDMDYIIGGECSHYPQSISKLISAFGHNQFWKAYKPLTPLPLTLPG